MSLRNSIEGARVTVRLNANLWPKANHLVIAVLRLVQVNRFWVAFELRDQTRWAFFKRPALRVAAILVNKANLARLFVPATFFANPVKKRPAHPPIVQIRLSPVGYTTTPEE